MNVPILCRVCEKKMGVVAHFEGRIFTLCPRCERLLRALKKKGILPGKSTKK